MAAGRKARAKIDYSNETKLQKFVRLANLRAKNARKALQGLGKLGTSAYERPPEAIAKLKAVLQKELDDAIAKLSPSAREAEQVDILSAPAE